MSVISSIEELEAIYDVPEADAASMVKVTPSITEEYQALIEASPFMALATVGPEGIDCSPRGDAGSVVRIVDENTIHIPDRRGNNRVDSLRNIVRDGRIALLFFLPGSNSTIRVNGKAEMVTDESLLQAFVMEDQLPRSVVVVHVQEVYFQCGRAIVRADLWNADKHIDLSKLPTPGCILANLSDNQVGGEEYDREWPQRAKETLW